MFEKYKEDVTTLRPPSSVEACMIECLKFFLNNNSKFKHESQVDEALRQFRLGIASERPFKVYDGMGNLLFSSENLKEYKNLCLNIIGVGKMSFSGGSEMHPDKILSLSSIVETISRIFKNKFSIHGDKAYMVGAYFSGRIPGIHAMYSVRKDADIRAVLIATKEKYPLEYKEYFFNIPMAIFNRHSGVLFYINHTNGLYKTGMVSNLTVRDFIVKKMQE